MEFTPMKIGADALGSIRLLVHESGAIAESYAYDVYGRPRVMYTVGGVSGAGPDGNWLTEDTATQDASAVGNPYLFTARRWDAATGLYHYRHRDYSPTLGRFLQTDPLLYIDGMNLYAYCGNNPINRVDPMGQAWSWIATGAGALVGAVSGFTYSATKELISNADDFNWGNVLRSTAVGAARGAIAGAVVGACMGGPSAAAVGASVVGGGLGGLWVGAGEGVIINVTRPNPERPDNPNDSLLTEEEMKEITDQVNRSCPDKG